MNTFSVARAERLGGRERLRRTLSWGGPAVYLVVLTVFVLREGVPLSRERLLMWILLGLLAFSLTNVRAWSRGVVSSGCRSRSCCGRTTSCEARPTRSSSRPTCSRSRADEILFGGTAPDGLAAGAPLARLVDLHWYDYVTWVVYVSYFLATYLVAAFLWFFARGLFRRFVAMVSLLALMGFATYALFPAAPPWMASEFGQLEPTTRSIGSIWNRIPIAYFDSLFDRGSEYANPVAAVPSLHAAYTLLIALFLWRLAPLWGRVRWPPTHPRWHSRSSTRPSTTSWTSSSAGPTPWSFWTVNYLADRIAGARAPRARLRTSHLRSSARRAVTRARSARPSKTSRARMCSRSVQAPTGAHQQHPCGFQVRPKPNRCCDPHRGRSVTNDAAKNRSSQPARSSDRPRASPDPTSPRDSC